MLARITGWDGLLSNRPPVLDSIGSKSVQAGDTLVFEVAATDPDSDDIALSTTSLPPHAIFTDERDGTGIFHFFPDSTQAGLHEVLFVASDGELTDSELVPILVTSIRVEERNDVTVGPASSSLNVFPNPLGATAEVAFTLPGDSRVALSLYDAAGREIKRLDCGFWSGGSHQIPWAVGNLASGVYYLKLRSQYGTVSKKVVAID
jgi:hypothetical protein